MLCFVQRIIVDMNRVLSLYYYDYFKYYVTFIYVYIVISKVSVLLGQFQ